MASAAEPIDSVGDVTHNLAVDIWPIVDRGTRRYWKMFGRRIDLDGKHSWLRAPTLPATTSAIEDTWLRAEAERVGGRIDADPQAGLLSDIGVLGGEGFDPTRLHPNVRLISPPGPFGSDGAYITVVEDGGAWAARMPLHEEFHVFADGANLVRTDHTLAISGATALRLHYLLVREQPGQ